MWIIWALISALSAASRRTNEKLLTQKINHFALSFATQLLSLPVIAIAVMLGHAWLNPFHVGLAFWLPLVTMCIGFYPLNAILYLHAIRNGELSKVLPIQSLWPVFSLLPGWLILHQVPGLIATIGVLLIVLGVYALGLKGKRLHHPLQPFREERSSLFMLLSVILVTVTSVLDKIAIQASNAIYYSLISTVGAVLVLYVTMLIRNVHAFSQLRAAGRNLSLTGALQGVTYTTYSLAIGAGPIAYVSAIRSSSIFIGALLGIVVFKEKLSSAKIVSLVLIFIGGTVLALGS